MTVPGAHFFAGRVFLRRATTGKPIAPCDPASFPIRYSLFAIRYSPLCFGATMSLTVAVQMDPIEKIRIAGDSTFALLLEGQARGHRLLYYTPDRLSMRDGKVVAQVQALGVRDVEGDHYGVEAAERLDLSRVDVVLMRQDPPFDMAYITTTHLLERIHPNTLVVNDPAAVRNAPEKVFVLDFLDLMPPTLVTRSADAIRAFRDEHKDIVIKPLYGNGGAAVFHIAEGDTNLNSLIELLGLTFREPIMVQRYVPQVRQGDKRIILVDGDIAGAINRVPSADETRSNLHVGGRAEPARLTARDREICARLAPELKRRGLIFVGI